MALYLNHGMKGCSDEQPITDIYAAISSLQPDLCTQMNAFIITNCANTTGVLPLVVRG